MTLTVSPDVDRDALTGLIGRDAARAELANRLGLGAQVQVMLIGLRRFDAINLAYGAATGDAVLGEVANRLKHFAAAEFDGAWFAARATGGQFVLVCQEACSRERWQLLAAQLLDCLARPMAVLGSTVRLSPRAALLRGLAGETADSMFDRLGHTLDGLIVHPGRRYAWPDGEGIRAGRSTAQLEADLLMALDRNEIEVVFQPQYACGNERLVGAEALARWNHPALGRVGAGGLFAVAERTDHVAQLSRHIARLALNEARRWPGDLRLSLNVTPSDIAAADFCDSFKAVLQESRFPAWQLTLEVTEQVLMSDVGSAAKAFAELAAIGIKFALDDFGAGFCNFRYLKLLPLDYLKLDRAMIDGVTSDGKDLAVLRAIVAMAHALELAVIAEGVENEAQRLLVAVEGCTYYQGFHRSPPLAANAFLREALG